MEQELVKKKIKEKDKARKKYLEKLELLKQKYGVRFIVNEFNNNNIDNIKFYNMRYKKGIKNVSLIYDAKINKFNYISYDYDIEKDMKGITNHQIIMDLNKEKKLKLIIEEIKKANNEYQLELASIDEKYSKIENEESENIKELDLTKKNKQE